MARVYPESIDIRLTDVDEVREVVEAARAVLAEVEGRGLIRSYERPVARLHSALEAAAEGFASLEDAACTGRD